MAKKLLSAYWWYFKRLWKEPWFYILLLLPLMNGGFSIQRFALTTLFLVLFFPIIAIIVSITKQKKQ